MAYDADGNLIPDDNTTPQDVANAAPGGLPDDNPAAQAYQDSTTPPSAEAVGPPQEGVPAPTNDKQREAEDTARNTTQREATGMDPSDPLGNIGRRVGDVASGLWGASHAPGTDDPLGAGIGAIRDYLTGKNAMPAGDVAAAIKRANPDGNLSPDVALHKATADEPDWEKKSALQSGALKIARDARAHARAAADNNDWTKADAFMNEGAKYLPDGNQLKFTRHDNGVVASISKLGTDQTDVINLTPQQYSTWLHSHASDPDALMRGDAVDSLRQVAAPQRGEAGPSMGGVSEHVDQGQPGNQGTARDTDIGPTPSQLMGEGATPQAPNTGGRLSGEPEWANPEDIKAGRRTGVSEIPPSGGTPGGITPTRNPDLVSPQDLNEVNPRANRYERAAAGQAGGGPDAIMAQRENDLAQRAEERRLAQRVAPGLQPHANEIAQDVLDTQLGRYNDMERARQQLSAGKNVDMGRFGNAGRREDYVGQAERAIGNIRRDKDGNLWTQDGSGQVVPYNTATADQQAHNIDINPGVIPRSVASDLGAQERAQYDRGLDVRARTSQAAAQEKIRRGGEYDAFDANMAATGNRLGSPEEQRKMAEFYADNNRGAFNPPPRQQGGQPGGNYDSEGRQVEPPQQQPHRQQQQRGFRRGGHRRRRQ